MSTIKTETLSTPSNATVPVDTVVNGTAKAWINFNGTGTVAIRRAFNVSSITDNGTGDYTVNFTSALADADYAVTHTAGVKTIEWGLHLRHNSVVPTASAYRFHNVTPADSNVDTPFINITVHR